MANRPLLTCTLVTTAMVATLALAASPASAGRDELLLEVAKAAPQVRYYRDDISINSRWEEVSRGKAKIDACLKAVDAALAAGVKPGEEFMLATSTGVPTTRSERDQRGGRVSFSNLKLIRSFCAGKRAKVQLLRTSFALREAKQRLDRIHQVTNPARLARAALAERVCSREVARALAMKNSPTIAFDRPEVTLGKAAQEICAKLGSALATVRADMRKKTDVSGFHKALSGDRRRLFDEHMLFAAEVYGPDKYPLAEADDFANIDTWYLVMPDIDDFGQAGWVVAIYGFAGDKISQQRELRGQGRTPPAKVFKAPATAPSALE